MSQQSFSRRKFLQVSGISLAGGILAACAPAQAPSAPAAQPAVAATEAPAAMPAAAVGPQGGGTLRAAFASALENFNPMLNIGGVRVDTNKRVYSTLVQFDNLYSMAPDLAKDWDISADGLVYTFRLHETAKWHDGTPCTAADVIFTMELNANLESGSSNQKYFEPVVGGSDYTNGQADSIAGITAVDDFTVRFELVKPFSSFLANFAKLYILPRHLLGDVAPSDLITHPFMVEAPIGTGPYKLSKYTIDKGVEYERYVDYHFGVPLIEKMTWDYIPDRDSILLAMEKGDIDYSLHVTFNTENLERIENTPSLQVVTAPQPFTSGLLFSHTVNPGWADKRVRQAVAHGLNRENLLLFRHRYSSLFENLFDVAWAKHPTLRWSDRYPLDIDKAKALLAEADWDPETPLVWSVTSQPSDEAVYIQEQLADLDINVTFEQVDGPTVVKRLYTDKNSGIYYGGAAWEDPYYFANRWLCSEVRPGGLSWSTYCNPEVEALMEQEAATTTLEQRGQVYNQVEEVLVEDCVMVPAVYSPTLALFSTRVNVPRYTWYVHDYSWEWSLNA